MERISNAVYTKEFREEAVRMVLEHGLSAYEVAQSLSIPKSTITYWVREAKKGRLSLVGSTKKVLSETERPGLPICAICTTFLIVRL